jgi:ubiquinone/menaquinone biosynthesis C-methylase UbiE
MPENQWDIHYKRSKSILIYPDENLVRMIKSYLADKSPKDITEMRAIDIGCGTGRHLKLLSENGIRNITGLDYSMNALRIPGNLGISTLVQADNKAMPFKENIFDIAVSWGSLHYCGKDQFIKQLTEIQRIIKHKARLFGTLRSEMDTYLKKGKDLGNGTWEIDSSDIKNSIVSFYSEQELKTALGGFAKYEYGQMERTLIGDLTKIISHWFFWAEK